MQERQARRGAAGGTSSRPEAGLSRLGVESRGVWARQAEARVEEALMARWELGAHQDRLLDASGVAHGRRVA